MLARFVENAQSVYERFDQWRRGVQVVESGGMKVEVYRDLSPDEAQKYGDLIVEVFKTGKPVVRNLSGQTPKK